MCSFLFGYLLIPCCAHFYSNGIIAKLLESAAAETTASRLISVPPSPFAPHAAELALVAERFEHSRTAVLQTLLPADMVKAVEEVAAPVEESVHKHPNCSIVMFVDVSL